jgi:2-iminobutanoate/2-iminopropanoate deaminase
LLANQPLQPTRGLGVAGTGFESGRVTMTLKDMQDFEEMNRAYVEMMGDHRPARTVIGVSELPKPGVLLTMNLTAVTR